MSGWEAVQQTVPPANTRSLADARAVLEQQVRSMNEAYQRATAQNSMLEQQYAELQQQAEAAAEEAQRAIASARRDAALQQGLALKADLGGEFGTSTTNRI